MFQLQRARARRGLTLMELVIVIAILVALASIVIPLIPGLIGRAETSSRATNAQEIFKAVQTYSATYSHYPRDWDSLTDGTSTALTYISGLGTSTALTQLSVDEAAALSQAGINRVQKMSSAPVGTDKTFNPYPSTDKSSATGDGIDVAANMNAVTLTNLGQFQLGLADNSTTPSGTFVVFGFGKRASIVGVGVNEAPFVYFDNFALSPDATYSRYGMVFQVSGRNPTDQKGTSAIAPFAKARLVRVVQLSGTLKSGDDFMKSYWDDVSKSGGN